MKIVSNSSLPKVSVVIPCYNLGECLPDCIDSVLNQTFSDFEVIVVDDGSSEYETIEALQRLESLDRVKIIRTPNRGLVSARNLGISKARGAYICCIDADDTYHPDFLAKTTLILDRDLDNAVGIVTTWVNIFGVESRIWETAPYDISELLANNVIHVASLFRRKCWEAVGGYSSNLAGYQDWNFWISIVAKGYVWKTLEEPLFNYRIRNCSMVSKSNLIRLGLYKKIIENNYEFYKDNFHDVLIKAVAIQVGQNSLLEERWSAMQSMEVMIRERDEAIAGQARVLEERWAVMQSMEAMIRERDEAIIEQRTLLEKHPTVTDAMRVLLSAVWASFQHRVGRVLGKHR